MRLVAEIPGPAGDLPLVGDDRNRRARKDPSVRQFDDVVAARLVGVLVKMVDRSDERVPVDDQLSGVGEQIEVVRVERDKVRDFPDLAEAAVVRQDAPLEIDRQDAVEGGLLLCAEDGHAGAARRDAVPPADQPAQQAPGPAETVSPAGDLFFRIIGLRHGKARCGLEGLAARL